MKLLLVEDETRLAAYLKRGLTESGFSVDVAHTSPDGLDPPSPDRGSLHRPSSDA